METEFHTPVLVEEVVTNINLKKNGIYVDCTVGGGGHSHALLSREPSIRLFCFDQDKEAIKFSQKRLISYEKQIVFIQDNFINFRSWLALNKISKVDGILMDIGVSNHQIMDSERGFSFMKDGNLDMRMDNGKGKMKNGKRIIENGKWVVNNLSEDELSKIFYLYGEERYSKRIAHNIVEKRQISEIKTTKELAEIIEIAVPDKSKLSLTKSKARIFQAIRIRVNNELEVLAHGLKEAICSLNAEGRLLVISWHSLEDRIVKECFKKEASDCDCPIIIKSPPSSTEASSGTTWRRQTVCQCNHKKRLKIITKKPITPSEREISENSNSRSAKLRVVERI